MSKLNKTQIKEELGYLTEDGLDWLMIDVANAYGLDKESFNNRITFVIENFNDLLNDDFISNAESPWEYKNSVKALYDGSNGKPVEHMMYLDCTNQALQLYAVLTSCKDTGYLCNLSSGNTLTDAYGVVADEMNKESGLNIFDRNNCKKALMTTLYGKMDGQSEILSYFKENGVTFTNQIEEEEVGNIFQSSMRHVAPHAMRAMDVLQSLNKEDLDTYYWTMPDGFRIKYDVKSSQKLEVKCKTKSGVNFNFERDVKVYKGSKFNRGMAPNIIHSVDGYVAREIVRRMHKTNSNRHYSAFITTIHDAFATHPNNVKEMVKHYEDILCEINESNLLQDIMTQIAGKPMLSIKKNTLTNDMIRESIYKLS